MLPKSIVFKDDINYPKSFTWDKKWIQKYESPWSILEKFRLANQIDGSSILEIFGNHNIQRLKSSSNAGMAHRNLITFQSFDPLKTTEVIGVDLQGYNEKLLNNIFSILPEAIKNPQCYFRKSLTFCPECIKEGFHSIFHQVKLFKDCPHHQIPLLNKCPKCNLKIKYSLPKSKSILPFGCECGYTFITKEHLYFSKWGRALKMHDYNVKNWMNTDVKHFNPYYIYYPFLQSERYYHTDVSVDDISLLSKTISTLQKKTTILDHLEIVCKQSNQNIFQIKNNIKELQITFLNTFNHRFLDKDATQIKLKTAIRLDIYNSTKTTFKSVARFLRKHVLKEHSKCVKLFNKSLQEWEICPRALAYILWRKEIEEIKNLWDVESGEWGGSELEFDYYSSKQFSFYFGGPFSMYIDTIMNSPFYFYKENNLVNFEKCNTASIKWFINHLIAHIAIERFTIWLQLVPHFLEKGQINTRIERLLDEKGIPFYLSLIPKDCKGPIKFYYSTKRIKLLTKQVTVLNKNYPCSIIKKRTPINHIKIQ